jgi:hypothetical protein
MTVNKRLNTEELEEIRKRAEYVADNSEWQSTLVSDVIEEDVPKLLAEIERLTKKRKRYCFGLVQNIRRTQQVHGCSQRNFGNQRIRKRKCCEGGNEQ